MINYNDYTDYDFTNNSQTIVLPDFNVNPIPTDINDFVDEPVKQLSGLQKRLIFYPLLIVAAVLLGHIGGMIFFANNAYNTGLLSGEEIVSLSWYLDFWKDLLFF